MRRCALTPVLLLAAFALLAASALPAIHGPAGHACASHCGIAADNGAGLPAERGLPDSTAPCALCAALAQAASLAPAGPQALPARHDTPAEPTPAPARDARPRPAIAEASPRAPPLAI